MMDEQDAIESLGRLGLSTYEARVFVALQRLGTGTASDVADAADVPRSQVYGAADSLESQGLVEVQQATPQRYRPVSLDAARDRLRERFEADRDRAFEYVAAVQGELREDEDAPEAVWTVTGTDAVTDRVVDVVGDASDRVLVGTGELRFLPSDVQNALGDAADRGVDVLVVSKDDDVRSAVAAVDAVDVGHLRSPLESDPPASRIVLVDGGTLVLGVDDGSTETAIWSANSRFASVLAESMETWFVRELDD